MVVNDAADFAGTNGCYLYQGRDVKEDKDKSLKDQILVIAPHEGFVPSDIWLRCRKKLMTNITFQNGRKARNTWLAGKIKCGKCGYALKTTHNPSGYEYLRCSKRADHKGCPGCGTLRKNEFEQFIFTTMGEKFREFKLLRGGEEKANPKITAYQVELNSQDFTTKTAPDFYDYIIVDGFHHATVPTYQKLLSYCRPQILLGLTATPERIDGKSVLSYFTLDVG